MDARFPNLIQFLCLRIGARARWMWSAGGLLAVLLMAGCQSTSALPPQWDSLTETAATPMWGGALANRAANSAEITGRLAAAEVGGESTDDPEPASGSAWQYAEASVPTTGPSRSPAASKDRQSGSHLSGERNPLPQAPPAGPWEHRIADEEDVACGEWNPIEGDCAPAENFSQDWSRAPSRLREDAIGIVNWHNGLILTGALAAAVAIHQDLDGEVRDNVARHPDRWGKGSEALGWLGEVQYQVPLLVGVYAHSLHHQDAEQLEFSRTLISAYTINGLATLAVKGIADTDRPSDDWNDGGFGFPSFHTASSFCIASVVDEYYGHRAALPAYVLAGLIGWSRIDERDHELSDVVFGAAMGYVIGKAVSGRQLRGDSRVRCLPYFAPGDRTGGFQVDWSY